MLWKAILLCGVTIGLLPGAALAQADAGPLGTFGFGLEATGATCCISVRFWSADERGSEIVLNAYNADLFVTLRGLQVVGRLDPLAAYTGLGMSLRFGPVLPVNPFSLFMAVQGFIALSGPMPFYELIQLNVEATVELRPNRGFLTFLGLGLHVYF